MACMWHGAMSCNCNEGKGDSLSPVVTTTQINIPPKASPFRDVNPVVEKLKVVRLTIANLTEVAFHVLKEGDGGVKIPSDRQSFTWTNTDGRHVRFDLDDWVVDEWDRTQARAVFRHVTEDEFQAYGLGRL